MAQLGELGVERFDLVVEVLPALRELAQGGGGLAVPGRPIGPCRQMEECNGHMTPAGWDSAAMEKSAV